MPVEATLAYQDVVKEKGPDKKKQKSTSSSRSRKRKKKEKKDKKAKRGEGEEESPEKKKIGGKTVAEKSLKELYRGTGLDPDPKRQAKEAEGKKSSGKKE